MKEENTYSFYGVKSKKGNPLESEHFKIDATTILIMSQGKKTNSTWHITLQDECVSINKMSLTDLT